MSNSNKVPQTFLEDVNSLSYTNDFLNNQESKIYANPNLISEDQFIYTPTGNSFYQPLRNNNRVLENSGYPPNFKINSNRENNYNINKFNSSRKFAWREIMKAQNIYNNNNQDDVYNNPLMQNILMSDLKEEDIQNLPENYILNLIHTLQGVANHAIQNENNLIEENRRLNDELISKNDNYNNINGVNESLYMLQNQNREQKKIIQNYENKLRNLIDDDDNLISVRNKTNDGNYQYKIKTKQRFYCQYCANKKFKTEQYLEDHMRRRHLNYYQRYLNDKKKKKNHINFKQYDKKLEDMKKSFEQILLQAKSKNDLNRISDKINNLENLIAISNNSTQINFNPSFPLNNNNISNTFPNNITNNKQQINETLRYKTEKIINTSNVNNNITNSIDGNYDYELEKIGKKMIKDFDNNNTEKEKQLNYLMDATKQFYNNVRSEINNLKLERGFEKSFEKIKREFEINNSQKSEDKYKYPARSQKKLKTTKVKEIKMPTPLLEMNQSADEIKIEDVGNKSSKERKLYNINKENTNITNNINDNSQNINNNLKTTQQNNNIDTQNKNEQAQLKFSESDSKTSQIPEEKSLQEFYHNFMKRDGQYVRGNVENYLKEAIPAGYVPNKQKINSIIDEKINKRLLQEKRNTRSDLMNTIMKLYCQIGDNCDIYGDVYTYYSRNISCLLNMKQIIDNANNYHYDAIKFIDNKYPLERKGTNKKLFENVAYDIKDSRQEYSDFSFKEIN